MMITCLIFRRPGVPVRAAGDWRPGDPADGLAEGCVTGGTETQAASRTASRPRGTASRNSRRRPPPASAADTRPEDVTDHPPSTECPDQLPYLPPGKDQPGTTQPTQPAPAGQEPPGKNQGREPAAQSG